MVNVLYIGSIISVICVIICVILIGVGYFWIPGKPIAIGSGIVSCLVTIGSLIWHDKHT